MTSRRIYTVGSLKAHVEVEALSARLRLNGHEVFDDWVSAGAEADAIWQAYEQDRGFTYFEALERPSAVKNFEFDLHWLGWADTGVLWLPAGKSAHLELGWLGGHGAETHVVFDGQPKKFDLMYKLADYLWEDAEQLAEFLAKDHEPVRTRCERPCCTDPVGSIRDFRTGELYFRGRPAPRGGYDSPIV